jgi:hypothetical protein
MESASRFRRGQGLSDLSSRIVSMVLFAVLFLCAGSGVLLYISSPGLQSLVDQYTACKGRPAPWLDQLNLADQQAKKTDDHAVLKDITLDVVTSPRAHEDANSCLDIAFHYVRPNGHYIKVLIRDTDPPDVLSTIPDWGFGSTPTQNDLMLIQHIRDKIKINPREAISRTYADGLAFSKSRGATVNITAIGVDLDEVTVFPQGTPNWYIEYSTPSRELLIRVSPEDGRIIEKKER